MNTTPPDPEKTCANCANWIVAPELRPMFAFAQRLSDQLGRRVEIGYCFAVVPTGTGPTADGDTCQRWRLGAGEQTP